MYIINNLLSRCPNIDHNNIKHGWINTVDKQYAWISYIIKYHINSFNYKKTQNNNNNNNNTFCMPLIKFGDLKRGGKLAFGWVKIDKNISYIIDPMIYNTIIKCYKNNGIFVSPLGFFIFDKERREGHACVLIINFKNREIIFANPWGVICDGNNCWKTETYNISMNFLKYLKQKIVKKIKIKGQITRKQYILNDFNIIPFSKCSPKSGPQGYDNLCIVWSMMIIHLYMLNYRRFSIYEIIEYLTDTSYNSFGNIKAAQYDYINRQIIPENLTKEWFKKNSLDVPIGY
jgi:hypothetical protein